MGKVGRAGRGAGEGKRSTPEFSPRWARSEARGPPTEGPWVRGRPPLSSSLVLASPGLSGLSFPPAWIQRRLRGPPGELWEGSEEGGNSSRPEGVSWRPRPRSGPGGGAGSGAGIAPGRWGSPPLGQLSRTWAEVSAGRAGSGGGGPPEGVASGDVAGPPHCADQETEAAARPEVPGEATAVLGRWRLGGPPSSPRPVGAGPQSAQLL